MVMKIVVVKMLQNSYSRVSIELRPGYETTALDYILATHACGYLAVNKELLYKPQEVCQMWGLTGKIY